MRIGILKCGRVPDDLREQHGDYPGMFRDLLRLAMDGLEFTTYKVLFGELPESVDDCDVYIISGSRFSVFEDHDWIRQAHQFVRQLHENKKKTVGICFGHQLMARALGGDVKRAVEKGWGVGVHSWDIQFQPGWLTPAMDEFSLLVSHQDQVYKLPENARLMASSEFCPIAAFQVDEHFLALQGHPEFSAQYANALLDLRADQIGVDRVAEARKTLEKPVEKQAVANWIVNFLS